MLTESFISNKLWENDLPYVLLLSFQSRSTVYAWPCFSLCIKIIICIKVEQKRTKDTFYIFLYSCTVFTNYKIIQGEAVFKYYQLQWCVGMLTYFIVNLTIVNLTVGFD